MKKKKQNKAKQVSIDVRISSMCATEKANLLTHVYIFHLTRFVFVLSLTQEKEQQTKIQIQNQRETCFVSVFSVEQNENFNLSNKLTIK